MEWKPAAAGLPATILVCTQGVGFTIQRNSTSAFMVSWGRSSMSQ
jgi:hypothetical protein